MHEERQRLSTADSARRAERVRRYEELAAAFPSSPYLQCQLAHARYNLREFDEAQVGFEALLKRDPYRLDQVSSHDLPPSPLISQLPIASDGAADDASDRF